MTTITTNTQTIVTTNKTVVTHNGLFHADESFGVAFLSILLGSEVRVVRTRNPAQDEAFMRVVEILKEYILNFLRAGANKLQLLKEAEETVKAQLGSRVLVLDKFLPYRETVLKANAEEGGQFDLVTYPAQGQWNIQTIPVDDTPENFYSQRVSLPQRLWGLTGPDASKESLGGSALVFCHKTGFLAAVKADTAEAARKAAEAVIAEAQAKA